MNRLRFIFISVFLLSILLAIFTTPIGAQSAYIHSLGAASDSSIGSNKQEYIYYISGHHGHIWSKLLCDSSGLHISNGTTRSWSNQANSQSYDTINLLEDNIKTIRWGLDSLWREAKYLKPKYRTIYNPISSNLYIVENNDTLFTLGDAEKFIGKDSSIFNPKLQKLLYLMFWFASPSIREYIPTPADTL